MRNLIIGFMVGVILIMGGLLVVSQDTYKGALWEYQTFVVLETEGRSQNNSAFGEPLISMYRLNADFSTLETPSPLYAIFNALGNDGWEFVGMIDNEMLFKRRIF